MPFDLLASVYEKPSTEPVLRPKRPCRLGPILLPSDSTVVWHWAHRVYRMLTFLSFVQLGGVVHLEETGALLCVTCSENGKPVFIAASFQPSSLPNILGLACAILILVRR